MVKHFFYMDRSGYPVPPYVRAVCGKYILNERATSNLNRTTCKDCLNK